jgi:hypothetical protein
MLEKLIQIAPPPDSPLCAGSPEVWPEIEAKLGTRLPDDYKAYVNRYGSGGFYNFLGISSPFTPRNDLVTTFQECRQYFSQDFFPVFPDLGGLLSVGADENGNTLFWLTNGEPNQWPLVYMDDDFVEYDLYEMSLTEFLVDWISGRIEPRVIQGLNVRERKVPIFQSNTPRQLGLE